MNLGEVQVGMAGRYRAQVIKDGDIKQDTGWFNNLITDAGLDAYATNSGLISGTVYWHVGTGNTAPANTDTALANQLFSQVGVGGGSSVVGSPDYYFVTTANHLYGIGDVVGNVAELGLSKNNSTLISRALILDNMGSPTTITVAADEQLRVFYEYRLYVKQTDTVGSITNTNDSSMYNYTLRACNADQVFEWNSANGLNIAGSSPSLECYDAGTTIGNIEEYPNGNNPNEDAQSANGVWDAYVAGSFSRTRRWDFSSTQGNAAGGIGAMCFSMGNTLWQAEFPTAIPKDNTKTITGFNCTITWARAVI